MTADSSASENSPNKSERAYEVLAACLKRREAGEQLSDEQILESHADLRPELEAALMKMRKIDGVFDACEQTDENTNERDAAFAETGQLHWNARCPNCNSLSDLSGDEIAEQVTCHECGTTFEVARELAVEAHDAAGDMLGHFELRSLLGKGAFGAVWRARDTQLERDVALKLPLRDRLDQREVTLFLREASAAARLSHPNIVSVHEVGHENGRIYIVSDLIEGETLAQCLRRSLLAPRASANMCCAIAKALDVAHAAGVVHRDLKPSNILVDTNDTPYVTDFGMAKRFSTEATMTGSGQILGTPAYMSPEQARGDSHLVDARSDVYALGVLLYEMLTGETPFRGTPQMLFAQIEHEPPTRPRSLNQQVPKDLETICLKCLEKRPDRRYRTMELVADDLQRFLQRQPISARPITAFGRGVRWCQRKPALAATVGLLVLAVIAGLAGVTWQWRKTETALARMTEQRDRADRNKEQSWELIEEFMMNLSDQGLAEVPGMGELRSTLLNSAADHLERLAAENVGDQFASMELARSRIKLASLMHTHGDDKQALQLLNQAIDSLREHEREAPSTALQQTIVYGLLNRAQVATFNESLGLDSIPDFEEACKRLDLMIAQDPADPELLRERINALSKLGWRYRKRKDELTVPTLLEAIEACDALGPEDRSYAYDSKTKCYTDLAEYEIGRERIAMALEYAQRATDVVSEGMQLEPGDMRLRESFCSANHSLGSALINSGRHDEAVSVLERAAEMRGKLAEEFPKQTYFREHYASLHTMIAAAYNNLGQSEKAAHHFRLAVDVRQELLDEFPDRGDTAAYLAGALVALAETHMDVDAHEDALKTAEEAISLLIQQPQAWMRWVNECGALAVKARALIKLGRDPEAVEAAENAARVADMLVSEYPDDVQLSGIRISVLVDLIDALRHAGDHARAIEVVELNQGSAQETLASEATDSQSYGRAFFTAAGAAYMAAEDFESAIPMLENAIRDVEDLEPIIIENLVKCYRKVGREEEAKQLESRLVDSA